jgi:hypothetical protein
MTRFARIIALPALSATILGGAALGLAGVASAGTYSYEPTPRPGISAGPVVKAHPPAGATPGARWHREHNRFAIDLSGR